MRAYVFNTQEEWETALYSIESVLIAVAISMGYEVIDGAVIPKNRKTRRNSFNAQRILSWCDRTISHQLTNSKYYIYSLHNAFPVETMPVHAQYPTLESALEIVDNIVEDISSLLPEIEED